MVLQGEFLQEEPAPSKRTPGGPEVDAHMYMYIYTYVHIYMHIYIYIYTYIPFGAMGARKVRGAWIHVFGGPKKTQVDVRQVESWSHHTRLGCFEGLSK